MDGHKNHSGRPPARLMHTAESKNKSYTRNSTPSPVTSAKRGHSAVWICTYSNEGGSQQISTQQKKTRLTAPWKIGGKPPDPCQRSFAPTPHGLSLLLPLAINRRRGRTPRSHLVERSERRMCPRAVQHRRLSSSSRYSPLVRQRCNGSWCPGIHLVLASFLAPAPPRQERVAAGSRRSARRRMLTLLSGCCWCWLRLRSCCR